jgi:hypothetical protein
MPNGEKAVSVETSTPDLPTRKIVGDRGSFVFAANNKVIKILFFRSCYD